MSVGAVDETIKRPRTRGWRTWIDDHPVTYRALALALSIAVIALAANWHFDRQIREVEAHLEIEAARLTRQLDRLVEQGKISGGLRLMGAVDDSLKQRLLDGRTSETDRSDLLAVRGFALGVDGLLLIRRDGSILERWDPDNLRAVVPQWTPPPAAHSGLRAHLDTLIEVAADSASLDQSVLLLGPVWRGSTPQSNDPEALLGTLAARVEPGTLRSVLVTAETRTLLIAPNGRTVADTTAPGALVQAPDRQESVILPGIYRLQPVGDSPGAQRIVLRRTLAWTGPSLQTDRSEVPLPWALLVLRDVPDAGLRDVPIVAWVLGLATLVTLLAVNRVVGARVRLAEEQAAIEAALQDNREQTAWRAQLAEAILRFQGCSTVAELGTLYLRYAHDHLGTVQGVLYIVDPEEHRLHLAAYWACLPPPPSVLDGREGLLAQASRDHQARWLEAAAVEQAWVRSALGAAPARMRFVIPILHGGRCLAVAELGWFHPLDAQAQDRAQALTELLGVNIKLLQARS